MGSNSITLPKDCDSILAEFKHKDSWKKAMKGNLNGLSQMQKMIIKYCIPSLEKGRPLGSAIIFMAGQTGVGKSSTVNTLFDDPNLCAVSSIRSETKDATMFSKKLTVTKESPPVSGNLSFVDVPGALDTDKNNEAANLASIKHLRENECSLSSREAFRSKIVSIVAGFKIRATVYPNLVLLVISATDRRLDGPDSSFRKSIRVMQTSNIVDTKFPNLIIVATNAMSIPKKRYAKTTSELSQTVKQIVLEELVIPDVPVVFVENLPEDNEMELAPGTDFYQLPNGELSHENLISEIFKVFKRNDDNLSHLLVGWYFSPSCPERNEKAEVMGPTKPISRTEIERSARELEALGIQTGNVTTPTFNFQSLGYGYCPVNEEIKYTNLLGTSFEMKEVLVQNTKFLIPKLVTSFIKNKSAFHRISFQKKEEYQNHMKTSYGIEGGFKLVVQGSSKGRWITDSTGSCESSLFSLVQEMQVATFRLDDPHLAIKCSEFQAALNNLPKEYNGDTARIFQTFFSQWGTHMIYEQAIGGAVQLDCTLSSANLNSKSLNDIEVKVSTIFGKCFSAGGNFNLEKEVQSLSAIGVTNEKLQIEGGDPPPFASLATLEPEQLNRWANSVVLNPTELRGSIKLYPFYLLLKNDGSALRAATEEHLRCTLNATIEQEIAKKRDAISENATNTAINKPEPSRCFPAGTLVSLLKDDGKIFKKEIELLRKGEILATLNLTSTQEGRLQNKTTSLCTYLHVETNGMFDYLVLAFSNGKALVVSPDHLIFWVKEGVVAAKQAKFMEIGDTAIFVTENKDIETPVLLKQLQTKRHGAYAPLTYSGTFFADGFLVTSYADVDSFAVAQAAFAPLKMWHKMNSSNKNAVPEINQGIHPFAKILIKTRQVLFAAGMAKF